MTQALELQELGKSLVSGAMSQSHPGTAKWGLT